MPPFDGIRAPGGFQIPGFKVVRPMFRPLGIAASGLAAQRERMETIAQNIANADTTSGPDGTPYKRRSAVMQAATMDTAKYPPVPNLPDVASVGSVYGSGAASGSSFGDRPRTIEVPVLPPNGDGQYGVSIAGIAEDQSDGRYVYEPGHPDADAQGYVRYPNVNTVQEGIELMDAKRLYEANASVFQAAKAMLRATLDI